MLVSVEGCSCPNTLKIVSITCTSRSSASFHRPPRLYTKPTIAMLLSVFTWSRPNDLFLAFIDFTEKFSASAIIHLLQAYQAALYSNVDHSSIESSPFGFCVIAPFACG